MHKELIQRGMPHGQAHCQALHLTVLLHLKDKLPKAAFVSRVSELSGTPTPLDPNKADSPEWHLGSLMSENHSRRGSCYCFIGYQDPGMLHRTKRSLDGIDNAAQQVPAAWAE